MIELLQNVLDNLKLPCQSYSGHDMGSEKCLGILYEGDAVECVVEIAQAAYTLISDEKYSQEYYDLLEELKAGESDELGTKTIVYFPNIGYFPFKT